MGTHSKEGTKYQIIPNREHLRAIVEYFTEFANPDGRIHFTQREMHESRIIGGRVGSHSFMNGVLSYLVDEGFITKIQSGSAGYRSIWDVSLLLAAPEEVKTREVMGGRSKPIRKDVPVSDVEIEVIKEETISAPEPSNNNGEVMVLLQRTMSDMVGYLQNIPTEMGVHLREIANKLEASTDSHALSKLQDVVEKLNAEAQSFKAEKKDLTDEVQRLKNELEEALSKPNYNIDKIYRQRNSIMDEIDRMLVAPAWTMKQNGMHIRNNIESKLDDIMQEAGATK